MPKRKATWQITSTRDAPVAASSSSSGGTYVRARLPRARKRNARVAGYLGIEKKFHDSHKTGTYVTQTWTRYNPSSGSTDCVNAVAQGDGESQRDGKNYEMLSLHFKGRVKHDGEDAGTSLVHGAHTIRIAIVLDTMTNGAALTATDVFKPVTANLNVFSFRNLEYSSRFRVLWDKTWVMNLETAGGNGTTVDAAPLIKYWKANIKIPKKYANVSTTGTTANVSAIQNNSIHVLAVGTEAGGSRLSLEYACRLRFIG